MVQKARHVEASVPDLKPPFHQSIHLDSTQTITHSSLRRSPRKHANNITTDENNTLDITTLSATSKQRRQSPTKRSPAKMSPTKLRQDVLQAAQATNNIFHDMPLLTKGYTRGPLMSISPNTVESSSARHTNGLRLTHVDSLLLPLSKMALPTHEMDESDSEPAYILGSARPKTRHRSSSGKSVMSLMTEAARNPPISTASPTKAARASSRRQNTAMVKKFVLGEAECLQDLVDSDANDEGEDEDTDLSGFVVDDDAELSYHESMESEGENDSENERRIRKTKAKAQKVKPKPRRRLQRGRRYINDTDADSDSDDLTTAFDRMNVNKPQVAGGSNSQTEIIDLVTPSPKAIPTLNRKMSNQSASINLLDKLNALRLSPPQPAEKWAAPVKLPESIPMLTSTETSDAQTDEDGTLQPKTLPATPPRSPSKLKSPSKLLSPSKRGDHIPRSPHRQSMDAFWDLDVVNEWNDKFSPKKAPLDSPRKGLKFFDIWSDSEDEDSVQQLEESSDGLPSPCESPTKMRVTTSPLKSPEKAARRQAQEEKKAKLARKKDFDDKKVAMAQELFKMLDKNITDGKISQMAESTGGVDIIWSKTLRSTAGRANWKKTRTSASPSKNKPNTNEIIRHFASIELAVKVIDRPERLYDTLAHEFCHLANFMISGIVKEPHGAQFQKWAKTTTSWLQSQAEKPEWQKIKITTKHGYVIEHKYEWICTGRKRMEGYDPRTVDIGEGCGAEYGRHSKSIDPDKHRCGRCHGILLQIRPKPRASPKKANPSPPKKYSRLVMPPGKSIEEFVKELEIIELSD